MHILPVYLHTPILPDIAPSLPTMPYLPPPHALKGQVPLSPPRSPAVLGYMGKCSLAEWNTKQQHLQ